MGDAIDGCELSVLRAPDFDGHEVRLHWPDGGGYHLVMIVAGPDWAEKLPSFRENARQLKAFWSEHGRWPAYGESIDGRT